MATTQTFNISFPRALVKEIDEMAEEQFGSRSDFLRAAAIDYMKRQAEWEYMFREGKKIGSESKFDSAQAATEWLAKKRQESSQWYKEA